YAEFAGQYTDLDLLINDHDRPDGVDRAMRRVASLGTSTRVIPGVEENTRQNGHDVHLLIIGLNNHRGIGGSPEEATRFYKNDGAYVAIGHPNFATYSMMIPDIRASYGKEVDPETTPHGLEIFNASSYIAHQYYLAHAARRLSRWFMHHFPELSQVDTNREAQEFFYEEGVNEVFSAVVGNDDHDGKPLRTLIAYPEEQDPVVAMKQGNVDLYVSNAIPKVREIWYVEKKVRDAVKKVTKRD
ncbi:MAG: hypothetical protein Q8Q49_01455, partial [bacterium]|nr:hypothetical protein [bacterium]